MDSKVYVNGALAGEWKYGYSTFEYNITNLINFFKAIAPLIPPRKFQ